jgi:phosphoribosylformimino-5-aminoimidazole carboxamide ribotide isomerase
MILYPAIDIRGGQAVRLREGDFARETVFDADPTDAAQRWAAAGAEWIHIVDLDGARTGAPVNMDAIRAIRRRVAVKLQLGGGLRKLDHIAAALDLGIDRVVLGSVALSAPELIRQAITRYGAAIAVGLDARNGKLAANGWLEQSDTDAIDVAQQLAAAGVETFVFTDIHRDGKLQGPNIDALQAMIDAIPAKIIASGGVSSITDLEGIQQTGAAGAIIGRALYDGRVDLAEALASVEKARG